MQLPNLWIGVDFENCLSDEPMYVGKVQKKVYLKSGKFPVIDQSQEFISGYTNDVSMAYQGNLPVILFGDHTLTFKYVDFPFVCGADGVKVLVPDKEIIDPEFFLFYVKNLDIHSRGYSRHYKQLRKNKIILPPLPEQRHIVEILRQADMLRKWRRDTNEKARELEKALFYKMFGNPISNPRGWPKEPFERICDSHLGKMLDKKQQTGKHIRPYLRNINVQWGYIDLFELVTMDFDEEDRRKFRLKKGDVLICEGGEVGRAAIWEGQIEECYFQKALHRARPYEDKATSEYVMYLLWTLAENNGFQGIVSPMTIPHLTGEKLKALEIPVPPFPLQQEFTRRIQQFKDINAFQKSSTEKLNDLFSSIAIQAFSGELTTSWREKHKEELQRSAVERDKKLGLRGEKPTLKDFEEGRITPEEIEPLRKALGQFAVNVKNLAEPMQQSMLESAKTLLAMYQDIVDPLLQNIRQSMLATASVLSERIQPITRENFLRYIDNLPVPQEKRAIIETLDTTTIQVLKLAGTYPAYFTADDLEAGELGGITTLQAEGSLRTLQALGFVKLVLIDGLLRYRLTDENDYADLPSSLSAQS